jgi:hypothetical protein
VRDGLDGQYSGHAKSTTPQAALLWASVPKAARERILKNAFGVKCSGPAEMTQPTAKGSKDDLAL